MDLSEILSIAGKPGLFKVVGQHKNGVIVESLLDGKRFTAFANERMSSLEEISIFTEDDDIPLKEVFKKIYEKQNGEAAINHKSDNKELKAFFEETVPEYDRERVYVSDIKKVVQWYNVLQKNELLNFEDESSAEVTEAEGGKEETEENKKVSSAKASETEE